MRTRNRLFGRWQFSASVMATTILSLLAAAGGVMGFVLWSTADIDDRSLRRQEAQAAQIVTEQLRAVPHAQESVTIWDDAVINTKLSFNAPWVDTNLGIWMYEYFGLDRAMILNAADQPVYAMSEGVSTRTDLFDADRQTYEPLIAELRSDIAGGALDRYDSGAELPRVVDVTMIGGVPAIVSVMPIISDSGNIFQTRGSEFLHLSVMFLNQALATGLADQYQLDGANFSINGESRPNRAVHPILGADGRFAAFFEWQPERPGTRLLERTIPVLAGGFLIAAGLIFLLLDRLSRSALALETGRSEAEHQANHDSLTGLPNRGMFDRRLKEALAERLPPGRQISLMILDLDRFKQINDTRGHEAGDDLIKAVVHRLQQLVGSCDTLSRVGGDEFAVLHRTNGGARESLALANRFVEALARPFDVGGVETYAGVSVGVVVIEDGANQSKVLRNADIALHEAKSTGRGRTVLFEERMNEVLQMRHTIEAELREALRQPNQISVLFQPLYEDGGRRIIGAEALTRWRHPKFGDISPVKFIPVAEASGLIDPLGDLVLRKACELGARWKGKTIAVNISPTQLRNPKFSPRLFALLKRTGMRPEDLELEITEGILIEDEQATNETLRTFRSAGIKIALDDFGTGYSSLNYLKRYAVDRIKIDRSFVGQMPADTVSVAIVEAMLTLAHALDIAVTAEGVETAEQRDLLDGLGCDTYQGYLFSPAIAVELVEMLFRGETLDFKSEPHRLTA